MAKSKSREIVSNCGKLFRRFVEDESLAHVHTVKMAVLKTLTQTATKVDAHFREECKHYLLTCQPLSTSPPHPPLNSTVLIPHLYNMTELNSSDDNVTRKTDITRALVATYKELVYCCILCITLCCNTVLFQIPSLSLLRYVCRTGDAIRVAGITASDRRCV